MTLSKKTQSKPNKGRDNFFLDEEIDNLDQNNKNQRQGGDTEDGELLAEQLKN